MESWKIENSAFLLAPVQVFFVESICDDPEIIAENIKVSEVCVFVVPLPELFLEPRAVLSPSPVFLTGFWWNRLN